ncbi:MAG: tetratricopeptide repeat protein, partial [Planctomycetes bacterium]|nr:tetratricopeptide repeat protein [Planctomycetota bacterium]
AAAAAAKTTHLEGEAAARARRAQATPFFSRGFLEPMDAAGCRNAVARFSQALELDPEYGEAYAERARRLVWMGQLDAALADCLAARRHAPGYYIAAYCAGMLYMDWKKDLARAREQLGALEKLDIAKDYALASRARLAYIEGRYDEALRLCAEVEKLGEHLEDVHFLRGVILSDHVQPQDPKGAAAAYTRTLEINPYHFLAYYNRAIARYKSREFAEAEADCDAALRLHPDFHLAWFNRGNIRRERGELKGALADFSQALTLRPEFGLALFNRASVRQQDGDSAGAEADYTEFLKREPKDKAAWNNRAVARFAQQNWDGTIADAEAALALDPDYDEAQLNRGKALLGKCEYDASLAQFDALAARRPDWPPAHIERSRSLLTLLRYDEGIAAIEKAMSLVAKETPEWQEYRQELRVAKGLKKMNPFAK